jgi:hypothetical protein
MRPVRLDHDSSDRVLSGTVRPDDAPPGYAEVTRLLGQASAVDGATVAWRERDAVDAMSAAVSARLGSRPTKPRGTPVISKLLSFKTAVVASAVVLSAGTAAAATGSLPGSAQATASHVLHDVGISVPGSDDHSEHAAVHEAVSQGHATVAPSNHDPTATTSDKETTETASDQDSNDTAADHDTTDTTDANDTNETTGPDEPEGTGQSASPDTDDANDEAAEPAPAAGGSESDDNASTDHPEGPPSEPPGAPPASSPGPDEAQGQTPGEGAGSASGPNGDANGNQDGSGAHGGGSQDHGATD